MTNIFEKSHLYQDLAKQAEYIKNAFPSAQIDQPIKNNNLIIYLKTEEIISFIKFVKEDENLSFKSFIDLFGADMLGVRNPRFEVIYNLLSLKLNNRITIKVAVDEDQKVDSLSTIFDAAIWYEREVFDMFGIEFNNNPDLRRILTDYDFEGFPLRKDFPLTGFKEVRYDDKSKKVIYEPVKLMQEFRNFDFEMPWNGYNQDQQENEKK